jgi:hypothetical protein
MSAAKATENPASRAGQTTSGNTRQNQNGQKSAPQHIAIIAKHNPVQICIPSYFGKEDLARREMLARNGLHLLPFVDIQAGYVEDADIYFNPAVFAGNLSNVQLARTSSANFDSCVPKSEEHRLVKTVSHLAPNLLRMFSEFAGALDPIMFDDITRAIEAVGVPKTIAVSQPVMRIDKRGNVVDSEGRTIDVPQAPIQNGFGGGKRDRRNNTKGNGFKGQQQEQAPEAPEEQSDLSNVDVDYTPQLVADVQPPTPTVPPAKLPPKPKPSAAPAALATTTIAKKLPAHPSPKTALQALASNGT